MSKQFKKEFTKSLNDTNTTQDKVLKSLRVDRNFDNVDSLIEDKFSKTLENINNNSLESTLQSTLHLLSVENTQLTKIQRDLERDLQAVKQTLSLEVKQQRLNLTQFLLSSNNTQTLNPITEEDLSTANRNLELRIELSKRKKNLDSIKRSLRSYEEIPAESEEALEAKVGELETELKSLKQKISEQAQELNDSM